jgi:opacity protein-like surface antigen
MLVALAVPVHAQSQAELVAGEPAFTACLEDSDCADAFYRFLSLSMAEQGFTMQQHGQLASAVMMPADGVHIGGMLTTFPFAKPRENLSGKEENTSFSPVLPRLQGGWTGAGPGDTRVGLGAFFLPPIAVSGASALLAGIDLSLAVPVGDSFRFGPELDFTYTRARAPIVASEQQYENRDDLDNPNNLDPAVYEAVCAPAKNGCVDTFTLANLGLRVAASVDVGAGFAPYLSLGAALVNERLWVMYDDTTWAMTGIQPNVHVGSTFTHDSGLGLALGGGLAYRNAAISETDMAGAFFKLEGSARWTF